MKQVWDKHSSYWVSELLIFVAKRHSTNHYHGWKPSQNNFDSVEANQYTCTFKFISGL